MDDMMGPLNLYRTLYALALMPLCPLAQADSFYVATTFECDKTNDRMVARYYGEYNDAGKAMLERLGIEAIDPWTLIEVTNDHISKESIIEKHCELSDGRYDIEIGPAPGNRNIQGRCGAFMSARVVIRKGDHTLYDGAFEQDCHGDYPVRTQVSWKPGSREAQIIEVPHEKFYDDDALSDDVPQMPEVSAEAESNK